MLKKLLYAILSVLIVCLALVLAVFFSPSLQRSLVLMVLDKNTDQARLESFELGWNELELKGLYLMKDGMGLGLDSLDFEGAFTSLIFGGAYDIDEVKVKGLVLDMRQAPPAKEDAQGEVSAPLNVQPIADARPNKAPSSDKKSSGGPLSLLPKPLKLGELSVDGKAYLADSRVVTFEVDGGDFEPGKTGKVKLDVDVKKGDSKDAEFESTLELAQGTESKNPSLELKLKAEGETKTHMDDLGPRLEEVSFKGHFAFGFKDGKLVLKTMDSTFSDAKGESLCSLELKRELNIPTTGDISEMLDLTGELIRFKLSQLPLALVDSLVPDYSLSGTLNPWSFTVEGAGKGTFNLKPEAPLSISKLTVASKDAAMLDALDISVTPSAQYVFGKEANAHLDTIALHDGNGAKLLSGDVQATMVMPSNDPSRGQMQGTLNADLPKLFAQPVLASFNNMAKGNAEVTVSGNCAFDDDNASFKAEIDLKDIQSKQAQSGTSATINTTASVLHSGAMTFDVPVNVQGSAGMSAGTLMVNKAESGKLTVDWKSDTLYVDDLLALSEAFQSTGTAPKAAVPAKDGGAPESGVIAAPKPAEAPAKAPEAVANKAFWAGVDAEATARVSKIIQGGTLLVENLNAKFQADDQQMMLETFSAQLLGAPLNLGGGLTFDETAATPYGLKGQLSLKQFDLGKFLMTTKMTPSSPVDGLFDIEGKTHSKGETLAVLVGNIQGDFTLQSQKGVFRPLMATDKSIQAGAAVVGIAGVVNSLTGNKVGAVDTLNDLVSFIQKIDYDKLYVHANRGDDLNIDLDHMVVQGPEILLTGAGSVTHKDGLPIPQQPLYAKAQLGAQGDAAKMLDELGLLTGKQNAQGYYMGPSFEVKGTAANPDLSQLYNVLQQAAVGAATSGGNKKDGTSSGSEKAPTKDVLKGFKDLFK